MVEKLNYKEILKIVDGCYYGQAMSFDENQLIKGLIMQQQKEIEYWNTNSEALKKSREYILEENRELTKEKNILQKSNEKLIKDLKKYANINPSYNSN